MNAPLDFSCLENAGPPGVEEGAGAAGQLPPVRTIFAAILWLSARHGERPGPETLCGLACQLQRLAIHPDATGADKAHALRLAAAAYHDNLLWLGACLDAPSGTRH